MIILSKYKCMKGLAKANKYYYALMHQLQNTEENYLPTFKVLDTI